MSDASRKLRSVLGEEQSRGYDDSAVIGGLNEFLPRWTRQARIEGVDSVVLDRVLELLGPYGSLDPEARREAAARAEALLRRPGGQSSAPPPAAPPPAPRPAPAPKRPAADLDSSVEALPGIREVRARQLARLGVRTVRDLLYLLPRRYDDYTALKPINQLRLGDEVSLIATVFDIGTRPTTGGQRLTTAVLSDGTGTIRASWFNRRGLEQRLRPGMDVIVSGKVDQFLGYLRFTSPDWEPLTGEHLSTARLVPVYPLTEGLNQLWLRKVIKGTIDAFADQLEEPLPEEMRQSLSLPALQWAVANIHFPDDWEKLDRARKRLAFDEFLMLQLGMLRRKHAARQADSVPLPVDEAWLDGFRAGLPFPLTGAQERSLQEIRRDLERPHPMSRLLQGDVGSGKTVVALAAMLMAIANGKQAALMAPTEILAEQHLRTIDKLLAQAQGGPFAGARPVLLVGSLSPQEKAAAQEAVAAGSANLVIGTHALIQEKVSFAGLGLVVVDEQHRFGVEQRAQLAGKGDNPHLLAMSATPIPRTLALTLFGDLDVSTIDEMPPGRRPVATFLRTEREREKVYRFMRMEAQEGRQSFVICPVINGSEESDLRAATDEYERLRDRIFEGLRVGLLHGQMPAAEKDGVMQSFSRGEVDVLVATSVVEVGIDVPNATFLLVEEAHRFGLAQLHQFRGRVGRGAHKSFCVLMSDEGGELAERRLKAIEKLSDGFALAEIDLQLRGPGEFFGTRQSGLPDLKAARLSDVRTLELARQAAESILEADPDLTQPAHGPLSHSLYRFWGEGAPPAS